MKFDLYSSNLIFFERTNVPQWKIWRIILRSWYFSFGNHRSLVFRCPALIDDQETKTFHDFVPQKRRMCGLNWKVHPWFLRCVFDRISLLRFAKLMFFGIQVSKIRNHSNKACQDWFITILFCCFTSMNSGYLLQPTVRTTTTTIRKTCPFRHTFCRTVQSKRYQKCFESQHHGSKKGDDFWQSVAQKPFHFLPQNWKIHNQKTTHSFHLTRNLSHHLTNKEIECLQTQKSSKLVIH